MKRRHPFGRNLLFNALGILAILILFAAGMFAGMSRKLIEKNQPRPMNRNPVGA
jgi:hypothetical protein